MPEKRTFRTLAFAALAGTSVVAMLGCTTPPEPAPAADLAPLVTGANSRPDLRQLPLSGRINFAYQISGDPGAAPTQVFDDGRYIFMQFRQGEPPPIPMTHDGRLLEHEVMQGGLVRVLRVPSVVLRLGPRTAFVQADHLEVIGLDQLAMTLPPGPGHPPRRIEVEPPPTARDRVRPSAQSDAEDIARAAASVAASRQSVLPVTIDFDDAPSALQRIGSAGVVGAQLQVCHNARIADFRRAQEIAQALRGLGAARVVVADTCDRPGYVTIRRL